MRAGLRRGSELLERLFGAVLRDLRAFQPYPPPMSLGAGEGF